MAAFPGGWSSPFLVTLPTPTPPSMDVPHSVFVTSAYTRTPWVASMSSPPSLRTAHLAWSPSNVRSSTGRSRTIPLGVLISTESTGLWVRSARAAAFEAAAAQVPVVCPLLSFLLFT